MRVLDFIHSQLTSLMIKIPKTSKLEATEEKTLKLQKKMLKGRVVPVVATQGS